MLYTTLALLREANACSGGMATLTASLKSQKDDKLIPLSHILKSNGLDHAIWALRATTVDAREPTARFAITCALSCLNRYEDAYPTDKRPREAIQAASDYLDGKITLSQLNAASAARAASTASYAASAAAWAAAASTASYAASAAAWAASYAASTAAAASTASRAAACFLKLLKEWG